MVTSSYKNCDCDDYRKISISGDRGRNSNYVGDCYPKLAPKKLFWEVWHGNIGKISEKENTRYYVEEYYKQVLSKLDPDEVYYDLKDRILLCYEEPTEFCHRHIVAEWIKLLFEEDVPEIKLIDHKFQKIDRIEGLGILLETTIRKNTPNMRGFTSLKALRLFEKGEKIAAKAFELEETTGKNYDYMHLEAAGLRCQADDTEQEFRKIRAKSKSRALIK
jgi:GTPase SAR1 family protein